MRNLGAFAFAKFAMNATEELVKRLTHADAGVRAASTAALRDCPNRGPQLAPFLTPLLNDVDAGVRQQAFMTLRCLEPAPQVEISTARLAEIECRSWRNSRERHDRRAAFSGSEHLRHGMT